jgi:hypothetical protein
MFDRCHMGSLPSVPQSPLACGVFSPAGMGCAQGMASAMSELVKTNWQLFLIAITYHFLSPQRK